MIAANLSALLAIAAQQEDTPYLYGGAGDVWDPPDSGGLVPSPYFGFDCWKFIAWCVNKAGGPDMRTWWTDRAWAELKPVAVPRPGVVAFWWAANPTNANDVEHVELVVGPGAALKLTDGKTVTGYRTIGAIGGTSKTLTKRMAESQGARIKYRENHLLRPRFAGFRALPISA